MAKANLFVFSLVFLCFSAFILSDAAASDVSTFVTTLREPPPNNPQTDLPWYAFMDPIAIITHNVTNTAAQLMWFGQIILWIFAKGGALFGFLSLMVAPQLTLGSQYSILGWVNMVVIACLIYSVIPFE